jgi:hypothetical protein
MGAPIQKLRHLVSRLRFRRGREAVRVFEAPHDVSLDQVTVMFMESEDDRAPTAEQIRAKDRERAERFKNDQLLPVAGICGAWPGPTVL